jgi:hypothetical protein
MYDGAWERLVSGGASFTSINDVFSHQTPTADLSPSVCTRSSIVLDTRHQNLAARVTLRTPRGVCFATHARMHSCLAACADLRYSCHPQVAPRTPDDHGRHGQHNGTAPHDARPGRPNHQAFGAGRPNGRPRQSGIWAVHLQSACG